MLSLLSRIDHLVYAAPDLEGAVEYLHTLLGVRATPGGAHPGWGTRNALIALGESTYLEVIGPDPDQGIPTADLRFGIGELDQPTLVGWAVKAAELERIVEEAKLHGLELGPISEGRRKRTDGTLLFWKLTAPRPSPGGLIPFFIDWGPTTSPAQGAAKGCLLRELRGTHPGPEEIQSKLAGLDLGLPLSSGSVPGLVAILDSPQGRVELRGHGLKRVPLRPCSGRA